MNRCGQLENTETQERKREQERKQKRERKQPERFGECEPVSWPYSRHKSQMGRCKTWTLDSGLDYGLDCGLIFGLSFGIDKEGILSMILDSTTHALRGNKTTWRRLSMSLKFDPDIY